MKDATNFERVGNVARRLVADGHVEHEIDAWRVAVRLAAAYEPHAGQEDATREAELGRPPRAGS